MASAQYSILKSRWEKGSISENMLRKYVKVGRITAEEFTEITGIEY